MLSHRLEGSSKLVVHRKVFTPCIAAICLSYVVLEQVSRAHTRTGATSTTCFTAAGEEMCSYHGRA